MSYTVQHELTIHDLAKDKVRTEGDKKMDKNNEQFSVMKKIPETAPVAVYIQLVKLMINEEIKKEDLVLACQIFLLINGEI